MQNENIKKSIDRLFQYLEFKKIPPTRLEKEIGLSNGYLRTQLKRHADLGETIINKIINYCLDLNPIWFILGNGEMLKVYPVKPELNDITPPYENLSTCVSCEEKNKVIEKLMLITDSQLRNIESQAKHIENLDKMIEKLIKKEGHQ